MDINIILSEEQFQLVALGRVPRNTDDRWFVYYEDGHLYAHRSWSGAMIYDIHIEKTEDGYLATKFVVNRDPDEYLENNDHWDHEFVRTLLRFMSLDPHKAIQPKDLMWN